MAADWADSPRLWEPLSGARLARRDFQIALLEVRHRMIQELRAATPEEIDDVHERWVFATAHYRANEDEPSGWKEIGLDEPRPWELFEAELLVAPAAEDATVNTARSSASTEYVDGRVERWAYPTASFWLVLDQRVKRGKLATIHGLSEQTRRSHELGFIGRTRVGELVAWVDKNLEQARRASELHEIPAGFRATPRGVLPPWHLKPASRRGLR